MLSRKIRSLFSRGVKPYFSQNGEDILIRHYLKSINNGYYLDLGCYDPFHLSNTAILWVEGWTGVNVDANPKTIERFNKIRSTDLNIFAAIVSEQERKDGVKNITFYVDGDNSNQQSARGSLLVTKRAQSPMTVPAMSVLELLKECGINHFDYMNIDLEGYDEKIISEFPFHLISPYLVTIEDHQEDITSVLSSSITEVMISNGYKLVARTFMTSVFTR